MFYPGQEVVCIKNFPKFNCERWKADIPEKYKIYTIESIHENINGTGLHFNELNHGTSGGYDSDGFRPLETDWAEETLKNVISKARQEELEEILI